MAKPLTIKALENLKPGAARREVPDGLLPGLYFVMQPTGKASWAYRYRHGGQSRKLTLGPYPTIDLKRVRELARAAAGRVAEGHDPAADKQAAKAVAHAPDVRDLVDKIVPLFVARYARPNQREATAYETERVLNREVVSRWKGRRLSAIGKADIHELLDSIMDRGSPIQANRTLAAFRRLCGWAVERGLISTSPCAGIRAPAAETSRDRVLTDDELKAVWQGAEAIGWPFKPIIRLLILTGQRRGEIVGMRWNELDFGARTWTLPKERAKNCQEHVVPLSAQAVAILESLPRIAGSPLVFTLNGKRPVDGFDRTKKRVDAFIAGRVGEAIPAWRLHDLRRTFASGAARLGVPIHVVERYLNHFSGTFRGIVSVYQKHDFASEQRAAVEAWARHIEALISGGAAGNVVELKARG